MEVQILQWNLVTRLGLYPKDLITANYLSYFYDIVISLIYKLFFYL